MLPVLALLVLLTLAAPAAAQDPGFAAVAAQQYERGTQRGRDQAANPAFLRAARPWLAEPVTRRAEDPVRPGDVDPLRLGWGQERGLERDVAITNRYGVRLHGHLSMPRGATERLPAVLLVPGGGSTEHRYRGLQQGLAEAGYLVLGLNAQGDAGSQGRPEDPALCAPGPWQAPQELGIREEGPCAGVPPDGESWQDLALRAARHNEPDDSLQDSYRAHTARKVFAAFDGVAWLRSEANPWRDRLDAGRIGIAGHSLGSLAALLAGNGDPLERFDAVVDLDGYARLAPHAEPTVPTLWVHAELNDYGPYRTPPRPADLPGHRDAPAFQAAGVPSGVVVLGGSTHQDFNYTTPPEALAPIGLNGSRDGERVALHYTQAWFDRFLQPQRRRDALERLTARTYPAAADASSIGQGTYDPRTDRNVPPAIGGETAREHLSPLHRSWLDLDGLRCRDLRTGCEAARAPAS